MARRKQGKADADRFRDRFGRLANRIGRISHGVSPYPTLLQQLFGDLTKDERIAFVPKLFRPPVYWEDAAHVVWATERERRANRFPFLQGDVIQSLFPVAVQGRGRRYDDESREDREDVWMVLSPDCDCTRRELVAVAPAYLVLRKHARDGRMGAYRETAAFGRFHRFPVPALAGDDSGVVGYIADLREPFYLERKEIDFCSPKRLVMMTVPAWHILNAMLFHDWTRADRVEGERLRTL